jgi:hypothetical protein
MPIRQIPGTRAIMEIDFLPEKFYKGYGPRRLAT